MDILTRIKYELKTAPGAVVTFRRVTAPIRAAIIQSTAKDKARVREIEHRRKPLDNEYNAILKAARAAAKAEVDALMVAEPSLSRQDAEARVVDFVTPYFQFAADHPEWVDLNNQQGQLEHDSIGWARLRAMVVSIEGLTLGDTAITTADQLIEECPPDITDELVAVAEQIAGLAATERGESPWRGTPPQAESGPKSDTPAKPAESAPEAA